MLSYEEAGAEEANAFKTSAITLMNNLFCVEELGCKELQSKSRDEKAVILMLWSGNASTMDDPFLQVLEEASINLPSSPRRPGRENL